MSNKSPDAFRTISEVADWLGVPTHVLRFWESRFAQVKPVKRAGGRRYYRPADMALLGGIRKLLHEDGLTIRGVQKLLREEGVKHVCDMAPPLDESNMLDITPPNVVSLEDARPEEATAQTSDESPEAPIEESWADAPAPAQDPAATIEDAEIVTPESAAVEETPEPVASEPVSFDPVEPALEPTEITEDSHEPIQPSPDIEAIEETAEGIELLAHDAEPASTDWDDFEQTASSEPLEATQDGPAPETLPESPPVSEAAAPEPENPDDEAAPAPAESHSEPSSDAPPLAATEAETPAPAFGDISHIPEDPAEGEYAASGTPGLLSALSSARQSRSQPRNTVGLTVIIERLTALRARMDHTKPHDPRH